MELEAIKLKKKEISAIEPTVIDNYMRKWLDAVVQPILTEVRLLKKNWKNKLDM